MKSAVRWFQTGTLEPVPVQAQRPRLETPGEKGSEKREERQDRRRGVKKKSIGEGPGEKTRQEGGSLIRALYAKTIIREGREAEQSNTKRAATSKSRTKRNVFQLRKESELNTPIYCDSKVSSTLSSVASHTHRKS